MKIGILTFHSEVNYGSVLQAFAMQTHLEGLGHEVVIIDKYEDAVNGRLLGPFSWRSSKAWARYVVRAMLLSGGFARLRRHLKTIRMIRKYLKRTSYHFFKWDDAPQDLGVDMISVGSDQVWNPIIVDPSDYLLKNVPGTVPGIAYAASIGRHDLRADLLSEYEAGFRRFVAIGVREDEARRLVESTGAEAAHVVDPTLLVDPEKCWRRFVTKPRCHKKTLFVYTMADDIFEQVPRLVEFAKRMDAQVELYLDWQLLPIPSKTVRRVIRWLKLWRNLIGGRIRIRMSASPDEFVNAIAHATWCVTESFHGLMFSTIFRKNVRAVVKESGDVRGSMSSRLTEVANSFIHGPLIKATLADALGSLERNETVSYNEDTIARRISESREWLVGAIEKVRVKHAKR